MWSQDPEVLSPRLFPQRREKKTWTLLAASGAGQPGSSPAWIHTPLPQHQCIAATSLASFTHSPRCSQELSKERQGSPSVAPLI